jgi:hypothetical protein
MRRLTVPRTPEVAFMRAGLASRLDFSGDRSTVG